MTTISTNSTTKKFFLINWAITLWSLISGLWEKGKKAFKWVVKLIVDIFLAPARFVGWIVVTLWNLFWNFVGCNAIIIISVMVVVALAMVPGPGWFALAGFVVIFGLTTFVWLFHREVAKVIRHENRAKWITFIGVTLCLVTFGTALPFILLGWMLYRFLKPRLMTRMSSFDGHHA